MDSKKLKDGTDLHEAIDDLFDKKISEALKDVKKKLFNIEDYVKLSLDQETIKISFISTGKVATLEEFKIGWYLKSLKSVHEKITRLTVEILNKT